MQKPKTTSTMLIPTVIMGILAVVLLTIGYSKGQDQHILGLKFSLTMLYRILPLLVFAFIVAGMIQILIPTQLITQWVGIESGIKGIFLGTLAGCLAPGGPFVTFPIAAGILGAGASIGTMVVFLTSWALWAVLRLPMEIGIMGWKFTAIRLGCTFMFPVIAGLIANYFFRYVKL